MKKLVSLLVVMAWAWAVPSLVLAAKVDKVLIAHLAEVVEEMDEGELVCTYFYNVIEVSGNAVAAHLGHGDLEVGDELPDETTWEGGSKGDKFEVSVCLD